MTLRTRTLLMATFLLAGAVLVTATVLIWTARQSLLAQTEADGIAIARLLTRGAGFTDQVPRDVEDAIGQQMTVEATIAAHLVSVAAAAAIEAERYDPDSLADVAMRTDELGQLAWVF